MLSPAYVIKTAKKGLLGRASFLSFFGDYSRFSAGDRGILDFAGLRGVRRASEIKR